MIYTAIQEAFEEKLSQVAVETVDSSWLYRDLLASARDVNASLRAGGIRPAEAVAIIISNKPEDIASFIGVWAAEGVCVPIHASVPKAVSDALIGRCGARFCVREASVTERVTEAEPRKVHLLERAGLIVFTSGSTGEPKGVVLAEDRMLNKLRSSQSALLLGNATRYLMPLQLTFIFGIWSFLLTLLNGGRVLMLEKFVAKDALQALESFAPSEAAFVPTMLRALLAEFAEAPVKIAGNPCRFIVAGELLDGTLARRTVSELTGGGLVNIYGMSETGAADFMDFHSRGDELISIGRPLDVEYRLVSGSAIPEGAGEMQIKSPFVMAGYLDRPDLTAAAFDGMFIKTGDVGRTLPDGRVEIIGRIKELIVRGGNKISPLEIENLFASHPSVEAVLSTGIPDAILGERIHLMVVLKPEMRVTERELLLWAEPRLERFKLPDAVHIAGALPLGRTGKVDRAQLKRLIEQGLSPPLSDRQRNHP